MTAFIGRCEFIALIAVRRGVDCGRGAALIARWGASAFTYVPPRDYRPNPFVKIEQYNLREHLSRGD